MDANPQPELKLFFFGAPRLERGDQRVEPDTRKAIALLAYLVVTRQPHTWDALAALLYPEHDESHARAALRRTLSALNKALGDGFIIASHNEVWFNVNSAVWVDVLEFTQLLVQSQGCNHKGPGSCTICTPWLEQAAALYRADFLAGFSLRDSPGFDEWQFLTGEELRRR